jgi:regulator of nucleoside diphosphate kinase
MKNSAHCITARDMQRLRKLMNHPDLMPQREYLEQLEQELDRAVVVESTQVPADVVTMNSTLKLVELNTGQEMVLTLVYPADALFAAGRMSVLAPVGTAVLGAKQGETIEWEVPAGKRSFRVEDILYQPEAAGEYML